MGEARRKRQAFASLAEQLRRMSEGEHQYGDAPIDEQYQQQMIAIMKALDEFINGEAQGPDRETAIVVMMFPFGDKPGGRVNYMSNGVSREDMIVLMKEQIARFEGQPEITGRA